MQKIDELFKSACLQYDVPSKSDDFHIYIPIEISDDSHSVRFVIRKGKKSKILILSGKQTVYLTDHQIICTILAMDDEVIAWFLKRFVSLYAGSGAEIKFALEGSEFLYTGIPPYPEEKRITLFSDTDIELSCFCFLLDFIFAKDVCWEKMSGSPDFSKRTLCKYIAVIDHYHNKGAYSRAFLAELGYPVDRPRPSGHISERNAFAEDDYVKKFDISNYM